jgi:hypothetical protein
MRGIGPGVAKLAAGTRTRTPGESATGIGSLGSGQLLQDMEEEYVAQVLEDERVL